MHKCLKCGRSVASVNEIQEGCPCGSKVFIFQRLPSQGEEMAPLSTPHITLIPAIGDEAPGVKSGESGNISAAPPSLFSPPPPSGVSSFLQPHDSDAQKYPAPPPAPLQSINQPAANAPAVASSIISQDADEDLGADAPYSEVWLTKGGRIEPLAEGAVPITGAQDVSMGVPPIKPDVANVRQLKRGVYEIDVGRLQGEPLVVQDTEGIYYVRLPFAPLPTEMPEKKE